MRRWLTGIIGLCLVLPSASARAAEPSLGADLSSAYIWRGLTLANTPVVQPWLDLRGISLGSYASLGVDVWTNIPLRNWEDDGLVLAEGREISEFRAALTLTLPKGFKVGYVEYAFPRTRAQHTEYATRELFAGWSRSLVVDVSAKLYYDIDEIQDFYGSLALGRSVSLIDKTTLTVEALAGVAGQNFALAYGADEGTSAGLYDYNLSARLTHAPSEKLSLSAVLGYAGSFDKARLPEQPVSFYGGVSLSLGF